MTTTGLDAVSLEPNLPSLGATANYLQSTHWQMTDSDPRTTAWSAPESAEAKALVVLPAKSDFTDTAELIGEALRVLAWIEKRPIAEVIEDINTGESIPWPFACIRMPPTGRLRSDSSTWSSPPCVTTWPPRPRPRWPGTRCWCSRPEDPFRPRTMRIRCACPVRRAASS